MPASLPSTADKPRFVAAMFSRIARRYDVMNTVMTAGQDARWRRAVVDALGGQWSVGRAQGQGQGQGQSAVLRPAGARGARESGLGTPPALGTVLDVGTGTGKLAAAILERRAASRVVGVDFAEPMVRAARRARPSRRPDVRTGARPEVPGLTPDAGTEVPGVNRSVGPEALGVRPDAGTEVPGVRPDAGTEAPGIRPGMSDVAGGDGRLLLAVADALRLPFAADTFDAVVSAFVVRNLADPLAGLAEQARVLRPGGRLVILEITPGPPGLPRGLYRLAFRRLVPLLGRLIAGDAAAYTYLPDSAAAFVEPERLAQELRGLGFTAVWLRRLALGSVAISAGTKPTV